MDRIRLPTEAECAAYARDGAAVLRGVLSRPWIERMRGAVDRALAQPSAASGDYESGATGRFFGDVFLWRRDEDFRAFALESPLPRIAASLLGSAEVRLFYDQLFVKEPGTPASTPWHQDLPYWPLSGGDILSIWVPFDLAGPEQGVVTYVRGSHLTGQVYAPRAFSDRSRFAEVYARRELPPVPSDAELAAADLISWTVEPGDVIVHHPLALHGAPGNRSGGRRRALAVRYLGDDARFTDGRGAFTEEPEVQAVMPEPFRPRAGERVFGAAFPVAWPRPAGPLEDGG